MRLVGSLCTGYGGLDMAAEAVFGGEVAWVSDVDPHVNRLLEARCPDVPNIGDLTAQPDCEPVDVITAGFPCQPASTAGRRKGLDDDRWIWPDIQAFVGRMDPRPRLLLLENVPRLLTISGGDAMAQVVEGLAQLGYVGRYRLLRASDVGACHRRNRWFLAASHADGGALRVEPVRQLGGGEATQLGDAGPYLPTPTAWLGRRPAHSDIRRSTGFTSGHVELTEALARIPTDRWGVYAQAIARHEHVFGRPAPDPAIGGKLNPVFVEWMMMLPEGWVTGLDLPRTAQLRILGNGVVPRQAAAAYSTLCHVEEGRKQPKPGVPNFQWKRSTVADILDALAGGSS